MPIAFDHVALGAHRISDAPAFIVGELGGASGYGGPAGPYRFWHWDFPGPGRIEVIEPDGPPGGFVHRFLESRGPGIHHVTFKVPSLRALADTAERLDYAIVDYNDSDPRWSEFFLHPKQAMGIVVQIVSTGPHEDSDEHRWSKPPAQPGDPPPPVTVVGVRLRSASAARARRQWGALLGGRVEETPSELRFTWPGSGMRIAVTIDEGAPDRSEAIELRSDRPLSLPEGPHPDLGAVFLQIG